MKVRFVQENDYHYSGVEFVQKLVTVFVENTPFEDKVDLYLSFYDNDKPNDTRLVNKPSVLFKKVKELKEVLDMLDTPFYVSCEKCREKAYLRVLGQAGFATYDLTDTDRDLNPKEDVLLYCERK